MPRSQGDAGAAADRRRPPFRTRLLAAVGWLIITPLSVCAVVRVAQLDESWPPLLLATGLTPLLGPPALVALGIGLRQGRRPLAVVAAGTAGVLLSSALSGLGLPLRVGPAAGALPTLRIFSANVYDANPDVGRIAEEILAAAPDLVALQEVDPDGAASLRRSGDFAHFPHTVSEIRRGASGIALWSRFPLADAEVQEVQGMPLIRATIVLGGRRLRLYTVHMVAPLASDRVRWRAQLRWLAQALSDERGPLVVAGDFNATRYHPSFRRLLSDRLGDAHERRGRGWAATWPRDRWPLPPLMRLDHILVSPGIGVRAIREGRGQGSDHRPIIADLVLPSASSALSAERGKERPKATPRTTGSHPTERATG
jgi:endonuclease/exonuclease/phosphatase family metal-dependent hydrolase